MMTDVRIMLADDHPAFRRGLSAMFESLPDVEVVGEAADGATVVALAEELQPDVVCMDVQMPGLNGLDATRQITDASPHIGILVLTMFEDDETIFAAMRAGARGFLLKGAERDEIVRAVEAVASGQVILSPAIADRVLAYFASDARRLPHPFPELTGRERDVLELIARGEPNAEIARRLAISPKTVRNQVSNIFNKLHVADRAEAIIRAREAGLGVDRHGIADR